MLEIEKLDKAELLASKSEVRHRGSGSKHQQTNLAYQQDSVTQKMLAISRHLSETTQRSAATLETLVASSASVEGTRDELQNTAGSISHSNKLLKKYGRREFTDKIVVFFTFAFFICSVLFIVQHRLFWDGIFVEERRRMHEMRLLCTIYVVYCKVELLMSLGKLEINYSGKVESILLMSGWVRRMEWNAVELQMMKNRMVNRLVSISKNTRSNYMSYFWFIQLVSNSISN